MALMPNARARRRGQAPQPRSGAPQAQGLTATPRSAARSGVPSLAIRHAKSLSSTKAVAPQAISATQRIYTSLTGTTGKGGGRPIAPLCHADAGRSSSAWLARGYISLLERIAPTR